jgi:hypothetical protein
MFNMLALASIRLDGPGYDCFAPESKCEGDPMPRLIRSTNGPRGVKVAAACAGVAIAAAACGSGAATTSINKPPTNAVLTAYHNTISEKSARITLHETVSGISGGSSPQVTISGTGESDLNGPDGSLTLSLPTGGSIQLRVMAGEMYLHLPSSLRSQIPGDKAWLSINLNELVQAKLGATLSQLSSSSQTPTQSLGYLQAVSAAGLTKVGSPSLDGVATTEYAASIDLNKVAATKSAAAQTAIKNLEGQLGSSTLPVKVWVDAQGRVRQLSYTVTTAGSTTASASGTTGSQASVTATIGFSDFGVPVNVTAPPAGETYDATNAAISASSSTTTTSPAQ